jgi:hypothetical protein
LLQRKRSFYGFRRDGRIFFITKTLDTEILFRLLIM